MSTLNKNVKKYKLSNKNNIHAFIKQEIYVKEGVTLAALFYPVLWITTMKSNIE